MQIKTITCHHVYNYGASLQAYALMKFLQNKGHEVEIIDYRPDYLSQRYKLFTISAKWNRSFIRRLIFYFIMIPRRILELCQGRKRSFDKFTKEHLCLTQNQYVTNTDLLEMPPKADLFIAGSDQIWNTSYPNGKDPSFYLNFAPDESIKASYAASFSIPYIVDTYQTFVKHNLERFDYISVRERTGLEILNSLSINGCQVCDPVFLLPQKAWLDLPVKRLIKHKYLLIYDFEKNSHLEHIAKKYAKTHNLKLVSVQDGPTLKYANIIIKGAGPIEFLSLIKYCDCIMSNSFHGTAFALIFNKEFYVFNRLFQDVNSRMVDLLSDLQLSDRLVTSDTISNKNIDYQLVNAKLQDCIKNGKLFLNSFIV